MTSIVKQKLVFLDSDAVSLEGDDLHVNFPSGQITAGDGQFLRISLQSFSMIKNFYNINSTNNTMALKVPGSGKIFVPVSMTVGNYATYYEIVENFAQKLGDLIAVELTGLGTVTVGSIKPEQHKTSADTGDRIMTATITFQNAHNLSANELVIQSRDYQTSGSSTQMDQSDSYEIFGTKRITDPLDVTTSSLNINVGASGSKTVVITGYFPMQRFSQTDVYLHSDLCSTNYASTHFSKQNAPASLQLFSSSIFAKIHVYDETITYDNQGGGAEFFFDSYQDTLTNMVLSIRDQNGRVLPEVGIDHKKSGNFNFNLVLRIDTIAYGSAGYANLKSPLDGLVDISSDVKRNFVNQGKPSHRLFPQPPGFNGQFFDQSLN